MNDDSSDNLGFAYRATKSGEVFISRHGKNITTLRGHTAKDFLSEAESVSADEQQQIMARLTGNYKHGNERAARDHPRNKKQY